MTGEVTRAHGKEKEKTWVRAIRGVCRGEMKRRVNVTSREIGKDSKGDLGGRSHGRQEREDNKWERWLKGWTSGLPN